MQWYVAREELTRDMTPRSYVDPTDPTSLPIPDPTLVANVPVFYCLSNEDQLTDRFDQNSSLTSKLRVLWRYVGYPDAGSSTTFASPVIANVRGRDNMYHTMVFFCGTSDGVQAGNQGRIYALDAKGIALDPTTGVPTTASTMAYWTYPSVRPLSAGEVTQHRPAEFEDPNYNNAAMTSTSTTIYPQDSAPYNTAGHWWAQDQTLITGGGANKYYDGDIVPDSTVAGGYRTRSDTRIGNDNNGMGGIIGAPIIIEDPVNPNGPMLLVAPSVDGRLYTFDAGGRGDYLQADGVTYVPGTSQRIWTWPHFSADAYHWFRNGSNFNDPVNQFQAEAAKGAMPYSPAYDPTFPVGSGSANVHNPIVVSSGDGHVYGIQPFHDALSGIASNGVPNWNERRFWVYPHQGTGLKDPSANPLVGPDNLPEAPGVPTIYRTGATASINFTSGGRIYSLAFPTVYPNSGLAPIGPRWIFPTTPNPPYQDPTAPNTTAYAQGFSAHGLVVVPASVGLTPNDMVYALLTNGALVAVNYPDGSFYSSGRSLYGAFTESAPIIAEIAPDPALYSPVRTLTSVAQSVPTVIYGDSYGNMYGFKTVAESNQDPVNPTPILPIIYGRRSLTGGEIAVAPALASSNYVANRGGYYVVGLTNGQVRAFSFGFGQFGDQGTVPGPDDGFTPGNVSIDLRIVDAFQKTDFDKMALDPPKAYGSAATATSARQENGTKFGTTADPLPNNLIDNGNKYFALDQGGTLYIVASGVYHAQPIVTPLPNDSNPHGKGIPQITVRFSIAQSGGPPEVRTVTVTPTSNTEPASAGDPAATGPWPKNRWPDDRGITPAEHDQLSIYGVDYSNPNPPPPTNGNPNSATKLTGRAQGVYPWIAKVAVPLLPTSINGRTTFTPNGVGYMVTVDATLTQLLTSRISGGGTRDQTATDVTLPLTLGQRADQGKSNDPYGPDPNFQTAGNYQSPQRLLYITNPLSLTVRGYNSFNAGNLDQTGLSQYNIIGWYGAIDRPGATPPNKGLELTGNGAYVGIGGAVPGQQGTGVVKPVFAPFDLTQDNSSTTYQGINNGQRVDSFYMMDRSALARYYGPLHIKARMAPLKWTGTTTSVMNPLPFDVLPDNPNGAPSADYPNLDPRNAQIVVNSTDALRGNASLRAPIDDPAHQGDPTYRMPQPTLVTMTMRIPKYFPSNVNRGQLRANFRGTNIDFGGIFTDQAGFNRGVLKGTGGPAYNDESFIVGPLNNAYGDANANHLPPPNALVGSSPAGGYTGNVQVEVIAPASQSANNVIRRTFNQVAGVTSATNQAYRQFDTGISVAPTFRMKVLENTLDMGNAPHGTGYSDLIKNTTGYPGTAQYRYPFAPSGTGPYTTIASPWDINDQFANLALSAGFPAQGRFFRPFTLISDCNLNLVNLRVAKLSGIPSADTNATPNMSGVINNSSLSQNPPPGVARAARLQGDQVNNLLSPPMIAAPFGLLPSSGAAPNYLGNIGVVSSFDHDNYAQTILGENNLYPIANPAVDAQAAANSADLSAYYGTALFGPQWAVGTQGRPSLHKPRPNDSSGSVATIPDKPNDFDYQANTLNPPANPTDPTYLQQQLALGRFGPPAMAIAVPLGTPVGTYSSPIFPYEDALPIQWQEWLYASTSNTVPKPANILGNNDGILNTTNAGAPSEPYANPAPILKVAVREARLTEGTTGGTMPQIDVRNSSGNFDPIGFNLQPSAIMVPQSGNATNIYNKIFLYWATNRQLDPARNNGQYQSGGLPTPFAPYNIAYSSLNTPYSNLNGYFRGDADFGYYKGNNAPTANGIQLPQWWSVKYPTNSPFALLPGFDASGMPLDYLKLFPQTAGSPDMPNAASVRYGSPATTLATQYNVATGEFELNQEAYLTVQGSVDKSKGKDANNTPLAQQTETRTFIANISNQSGNSEIGAPDYVGGTTDNWFKSFLNDPNLPKLSPRPLLVKLRNAPIGGAAKDIKFLYVFWYAGSQGRTSLYYNVNVQANGINAAFDPTVGGANPTGFGVLGDQKLSTPGSLTWQSDPYPVFRRAFDPTVGNVVDAVDVMFTGQLKNRQTVEVLMGRYRIVEQAVAATSTTPALTVGQLVPIPFPTVHQETLTPVPGTNTYAARDAAWFLPNDQQTADTAANRYMRIYLQPRGNNTVYLINGQGYVNGGVNTVSGTQRGRIDPASGLVYFNAVATLGNQIALNGGRPVYGGGQIVVDARSGTVSFPSIPPGKKDTLYASYTPYIMRVNTSRDEYNIERDNLDVPGNPNLYGNFVAANFQASPAATSPGQNYAPTMVMDRAANYRGTLQSPQVLFDVNNQPATAFNNQGVMTTQFLPPVTRMWALYRKTDAPGDIKASVFMKSLRLMVHLPLPVATIATNGTSTSPLAAQRIQSMTVNGIDRATRGYEVDWIRGRVYFQEEDEGNLVKINYTFYNPATGQTGSSGDLYYRVAWGDEISSNGHPFNNLGKWSGDLTTAEVVMPTSSVVNEGQVAAFKDPFIDKLWVFWSSTRAGTSIGPANSPLPLGQTDLYYETLAPQFYSPSSNQY